MSGEPTQTRRGPYWKVEVTPSPGQTEASVQADLDASERLTHRLSSRGVEEWRARYRWIGPVKFMWRKEVGPPPWPWPKASLNVSWPFVSVLVGWRSTAFAVHAMWAPR